MEYTRQEIEFLIEELKIELNGHFDGQEKNLIAERCPYCGKKGKFAIYIGKPTARKRLFASNCFSCQRKNRDLEPLLEKLGRTDLIFQATTNVNEEIDAPKLSLEDEGEIDDSLEVITMPKGYKRCYKNAYLKSRGFTPDDYVYFPVGTTRGCDFKLDDYIILEIVDAGDTVGWVARHTWPKERIDAHNREASRSGGFKIMRYKNSTENDFVKLLYNYDAIKEGETDTVVIVEGAFDAIALTRKMELYDNSRVAAVATFGKKISDVQIYKLQDKGVKTVVIAYDSDARDAINNTAQRLRPYFEVYVADIIGGKDFDEMDYESVYDTFANHIETPVDYSLNKL